MQVANYTKEDLAALDESIASGELRSKHGERSVQYRDLDEMFLIREKMVEALNAQEAAENGNTKYKKRSFRMCVSSGL